MFSRTNLLYLLILALLAVILLPSSSFATTKQHVVAKVIAVSGSLSASSADSNKSRPLARRSAIFNGDTLATSNDSIAQIRFIDGAIIELKEQTQFVINDYQFDQADNNNSELTLLTGGFRKVTGAIPEQPHYNYKVSTEIAIMGLRGTFWSANRCPSNSNDANCPKGTVFACVFSSNKHRTGIFAQNQADYLEIGPDRAHDCLVVSSANGPIHGATKLKVPPKLDSNIQGPYIEPPLVLVDTLANHARPILIPSVIDAVSLPAPIPQ